MKNDNLLSCTRLNELITAGQCTVVDCRFDLINPESGRAAWLAGHIPGASYAHLDDDLAGAVKRETGRHPLPVTVEFTAFLASIGWSKNKLLVAYDDGSNAISARLWWMMRYFGQPAALLDGGLAAWVDEGFSLETGQPTVQAVEPEKLQADAGQTVTAEDILHSLDSRKLVVLDARATERFSGEVEFLDAKAGHIPGALNRPFSENLDDRGRFMNPERLRTQFEALLGTTSPDAIVHSCGSGVTACHNLFAMELAGLASSRLYPGSWSEWIRDPARPIKKGETP